MVVGVRVQEYRYVVDCVGRVHTTSPVVDGPATHAQHTQA
jgi:hypothetical protein